MTDKESSDSQNRRHFSRVAFSHKVILQSDEGVVFSGQFSNISLKGMLFQSDSQPKKGDKLSGILDLGKVKLDITGKVVAVHPERGTAICFQKLEIETFSHLRQLVSLNLGCSETIDEEFFASL
jgi:hypothetical protein